MAPTITFTLVYYYWGQEQEYKNGRPFGNIKSDLRHCMIRYQSPPLSCKEEIKKLNVMLYAVLYLNRYWAIKSRGRGKKKPSIVAIQFNKRWRQSTFFLLICFWCDSCAQLSHNMMYQSIMRGDLFSANPPLTLSYVVDVCMLLNVIFSIR